MVKFTYLDFHSEYLYIKESNGKEAGLGLTYFAAVLILGA